MNEPETAVGLHNFSLNRSLLEQVREKKCSINVTDLLREIEQILDCFDGNLVLSEKFFYEAFASVLELFPQPDDMQKLSSATGISVEAMREWRHCRGAPLKAHRYNFLQRIIRGVAECK